jgi:cell division protein FtsL
VFSLANTYPFQITGGTFFISGTLIVLILLAVVICALIVGWLAWRTANRKKSRP